MGLLDKFKKKKQPQPNQIYGPNPYMGYQQYNPNLQNPYGMGPHFQQRSPYPPQQTNPYQHQNYFPPSQHPYAQHQGFYQQPIAQQPQIQYNPNKLLQPIPFQNQPVIQSHNGGGYQQQSVQSQYPMTGQPPEKKEDESPGFFSRIMGGDTSITGIIGNMQRAVQTAQQVTPMIQQYSPIVKNIPSLYKIFKAVNTDDPNEINKEKNTEIVSSKSTPTEIKKRRKVIKESEVESIDIPEIIEESTSPKPKLFM